MQTFSKKGIVKISFFRFRIFIYIVSVLIHHDNPYHLFYFKLPCLRNQYDFCVRQHIVCVRKYGIMKSVLS